MITVNISNTRYVVKQFVFNDGSVQVEIQGDLPKQADSVTIEAGLQSPADQMALLMVRNAVNELYPSVPTYLIMAFCPYGRQDSVFGPGQANAMKAWASMINAMNFDSVGILDPHSQAYNLINNVFSVGVEKVLENVKVMPDILKTPGLVLVSPDAGANKKSHKICVKFGIETLVRADKARNVLTGEILETIVYGNVEGKTCLIVDDICDGGMTFIKLAEKLKEKGASKVILFVTHGLFTKGLKVFEGLIDEVYTTTSWSRPENIEEGYNGIFKEL